MNRLDTVELAPLLEFLARAGDPSDPAGFLESLTQQFPPSGEFCCAFADAIRRMAADSTLCPKRGSGIWFGEHIKPKEQGSHGFRCNAVIMDGPAEASADHTHTRGEITFAVPLKGEPCFDGIPATGWIVMPPGSRHIPTVTGGTAAMVYFWPGGRAEFHNPAA